MIINNDKVFFIYTSCVVVQVIELGFELLVPGSVSTVACRRKRTQH